MPADNAKKKPVEPPMIRQMILQGGKKGNGVNSYDPETRTAEVMISTGAAVRRRDPWEGTEWDEILQVSHESVRLGRLNAGAPLLDSHNYYDGIDAMLGAVMPGTARISDGKLMATVKFSRSERGQRIAQDLEDGIPINVSAGYKTYSETRKRNDASSIEQRIATDWEPMEISVAPIPAEVGASFRQHEASRASPANERDDKIMPKQETVITEAKGGDNDKPDTTVTKTETTTTRTEQPVSHAAVLLDIGEKAGMPLGFISEAVKRNDTPEVFRDAVIVELARKNKETSSVNPGTVEVVRDEKEGQREAMEEALMTRLLSVRRVPAIKTPEQAEWARNMGLVDLVSRAIKTHDGHEEFRNKQARKYIGMTIAELAAECLGYRGNIRNAVQAGELIQRAFHTTSDFPLLLENVMNKSLLARYTMAQPTYRQLAIQRNFRDFRPHPMYRAGDFPQLQDVSESGEIKFGTTQESKETVSVKPYGVGIGFSRQTMVNDDLGSIDQILAGTGDEVLRFENRTFFAMMRSATRAGPTLLQDSLPVYSVATHANYLVSGGGAPSVTTISVARAAMRVQKSLSGEVLDVVPRIILSGPTQETAVDQLLTTITPAQTSNVNPFSGKLTHVSDAHVDGAEWYLFADPNQVPCFVYGFLEGNTGPRTRNDEPFGVQGYRMTLEHDFGCGAIDFRGTYQNDGTA